MHGKTGDGETLEMVEIAKDDPHATVKQTG